MERGKILKNFGLFLILTVPLATLSVYSYFKVHESLTSVATLRRESILFSTSLLVKERLDHIVDIGVSLATRVQLRAFVERGDWENAIELLESAPEDFPYIDRASLFDPEGILMGATNPTPEIAALIGESFAFRDYYRGVMREGEPYVAEVIKPATPLGYNLVPVAMPIRSSEGKLSGVLLLFVKLNTITDWTRAINAAGNSTIYVLDHKGHLAAHPTVPLGGDVVDYSSMPIVQKVLKGERGMEETIERAENPGQLVAYEPIPKYNWGVVMEEPAASAFRDRDTVLSELLVIFGIVNMIAALMAFWFIRNRRQIEETSRMKTEFVSLAAHELRIPLATSQWYIKMLLDNAAGKLTKRGAAFGREVETANRRMAEIMDVLLNVSRIELGMLAVNPSAANPGSILKTTIKNMERRAAEKDISLTLGIGENIPDMNIDAGLFDTIASNLITNAVKYTPKGGAVRVGLGVEDDKEILLRVEDTGCGIRAADKDKIFAKFYRAENAKALDTQGVGLGLYIVKSIVEKTGGRIWFESPSSEGKAEAKGTVFFVSYPLAGMMSPAPVDKKG